ncbi:MAG TPA: lysoplasmalogenase [Vicinamibacteria bacterium]
MRLWASFLATMVVFFAATTLGFSSLALLAKPMPVIVLAAGIMADANGPLRVGIAAGLLASAVGDVLLGLDLFLPGLVVFLIAHLAYLGAFQKDCRAPALGRALPFVAWGALLLGHLWPALGNLAVPVAFYVAAISAMMWRAAARVGRRPGALPGLLGAVSFGLSDSLIAWNRFEATIPGAFVPIMLFYWLGQAGIARAALDKENR